MELWSSAPTSAARLRVFTGDEMNLKAKADLDFIICEFYNKTLLHLFSCQYDFQGCKHTSHVLTVVSESLCDFH